MADVTITGLEGQVKGVTVHVPVTAREITVHRSAIWKPQKNNAVDLQYGGSGPVTMTLEIVLDGVESSASVQPGVESLQQFTAVDPVLKRPPKIQIGLGSGRVDGVIPSLEAVIETCSVHYHVFDPQGVPLRAVVALTCREADHVTTGPPNP